MVLGSLRTRKVVATWSGGLDTTSLIPFMIEEYNAEVFPIFVIRQQENYRAEARAIRYFSRLFLKRYRTKFHSPFKVKTIIPPLEFKKYFPQANTEKTHALRNSDIVNQAVRYALILHIDVILVGSNVNDRMKDSSYSYWRKKTDEIRHGASNHKLQVVAPFQELGWDKKDMVVWCYDHKIPIQKSWSCWKALGMHCGACPPCRRRKEAFKKAQVEDLSGYLE